MSFFKKIIAVLTVVLLTLPFCFITSSASEDFSMKSFDKGYITFIFDDAKMPFTKEVAELFKEFGMPMSCAVPAQNVERDSELHKILLDIQNNGGEILSHGYNHMPLTSEERSKNPINNVYGANTGIYTVEGFERELGESWRHLTSLGFNVNGMIQVGCGGDEGSVDYALVETVARKYYKYSNASGVSAQYKQSRRFMNWDTLSSIYSRIDNAAQNKEWIILSAHNYNEISSDCAMPDTYTLKQILQHIKNKNGSIQVVTWNYIYNNFGEYKGPQVPTNEAKSSLNTYVDKITKPIYTPAPYSSSTGPAANTPSDTPQNTSSLESTTVSSESQTSSETIVAPQEQEDKKENKPKKKNKNGIIIAIISVIIAIASITGAIIFAIKYK